MKIKSSKIRPVNPAFIICALLSAIFSIPACKKPSSAAAEGEKPGPTASATPSPTPQQNIKADTVNISDQGIVLKMGTLLFPFGGGEPKGGPVQVVIFRSFKPEEMEAATQKNLKVGAAYLMIDDGEFKYIKDVDLKLDNHELAKQFGVDSKN